MQELHTLENSRLMDLLAKYTIDYTRMLNDGSSHEEYLKCKEGSIYLLDQVFNYGYLRLFPFFFRQSLAVINRLVF